MKYRWYLKHDGIIKRVARWTTVVFDAGYKMHRITLEDGTFHNSCTEDFELKEPTVIELLDYRRRLKTK